VVEQPQEREHSLSNSYDVLFYGGEWNSPAPGAGVIEVISPNTEELIGTVPEPSTADVDAATEAARQAFDSPGGWAHWPVDKRADAMERLADILETHHEEFGRLVSTQNGMPIKQSAAGEAWSGPYMLRYYASLIRERGVEDERKLNGRTILVLSEPAGVVAAIVPWNFPLAIAFMKLAPALAAGCTVVLKPAPGTVLDSYLLAQCIIEAGLPPGVINIIPGGREIGAYLVGHPNIDLVTFTGSTLAGRSVARTCAELLRPVSLELGGKSAAVVLDDANLTSLSSQFLYATMNNNGQTCWLSTRILVPKQRFSEFTDIIADIVLTQTVGDALDEKTDIGPMSSSAHRDRVEGYLNSAFASGARATVGGGRPRGLDRGWFVEPTVLVDVDNNSVVAREEIFGPVLCVLPYDSVDDAVAQANDSNYGLGGTVWTGDENRGVEIARRIRTGTVGINGYQGDLGAPFGGVKDSGIGRALGPEGLQTYQVLKSVFPGSAG
jgi:aldehyde dehydrogenase (NAD+)